MVTLYILLHRQSDVRGFTKKKNALNIDLTHTGTSSDTVRVVLINSVIREWLK
jgi:hypothetical protein